MSRPETVICTYRVKPGHEAAFTKLLEQHWPTLRERGLATDRRPQHFAGADDDGRPLFVEIFEWVDGEAPEKAHHDEAVMAVWGPMDELTEARGGRPNMEFPHVQPLDVLPPG